ncbi:MAG: decaprenyl-phosphate phosphoribosyltransferase [Deltaproteobacteria bacterium]|nr:decaprenyl-phosphate phosphoribosyltransferase [Deltaproteobacteria bacterium]TLN02285.1 MAG: decaprenyl-phosphate phosphoribosyltransferase [bacterium]
MLSILRPTQWLKNLMLFFPAFLGGELLLPGVLARGMIPFLAFCLASSSAYVLNDIMDRERDKSHPRKSKRPLPSGRISFVTALSLYFFLLLGAFSFALTVSPVFFAILLAYLLVSISYSFYLKHIPIIDLFCVSAGFLFRLQAGGEAFGVEITAWLFLSVFLLAIFLSTGKRLYEKNALGENAVNHRRALESYPPGFLDGTMYMTGGAVLVTYTLYVIEHHVLIYTVPLCCFGLLRYILRVKSGLGGDPTESLIRDVPLFVVGLLWTLMVGWGIYVH